MKKISLAKSRYHCQNCLAFWRKEDLKELEHIFERVPRVIKPAGKCPACGAVCHEVDKP